MVLHGTIFKLTKIYEQFTQCFPNYERYEPGAARGKVLLCPPHVVNSAMLRNLGKSRTAILTGWAVDPNCRYRYQCDAAFPLSDHADFPDLVELVKRVEPKKVYTLHGFAADFAQTLRELGYDAQALSEQEQLGLALVHAPAPAPDGEPLTKNTENAARTNLNQTPSQLSAADISEPTEASFSLFALTCSQIGADSRKL